MALDPLDLLFGNTMRINNALVEEAFCFNNSSGNILITYAPSGGNTSSTQQTLRLNINPNTTILNSFGQSMCLCCLQRGMRVNVIADSRMTRSIPPQSNAILIMVQSSFQQPFPPQRPLPPQRPFPPQRPSSTTTGQILLIDFDNNYLITSDPNNRNNQTRFNITNTTTFTNRLGFPIRFSSLQPGQMVRITHANFQTASIPPQTTAFNIQQL